MAIYLKKRNNIYFQQFRHRQENEDLQVHKVIEIYICPKFQAV